MDPLPLPLSPFEIIDAINRREGRETGPPAVGYVDENGLPVVPEWEGMSRERIVVPHAVAAGAVVQASLAAPPEPTAGEGSQGTRTEQPRTAPDVLDLSTCGGRWRGEEFVLVPRELAKVRRLVVGARVKALAAQARELREEVGSPRKRRSCANNS